MNDEIHGVLNNSNLTAAYIGILSFFLLKHKHWLGLVISFIALAILGSLMGLATFAAVIFSFYIGKIINYRYLYFMLIIAMIGAFFLIKGADNGRFEVWSKCLENFTFLGKGFGSFSLGANIVQGTKVIRNEHNVYLSSLNTFGICGFLFLLNLIRKTINSSYAPMIFGISVNFYGNFTIYSSILFMIVSFGFAKALREHHD